MWGTILSLGAGALLPAGLDLLGKTDAGSWLSSAAGNATEGWSESIFGKPAHRTFDPATGQVTTTNPDGTSVTEPMNDRNSRGFVNAAGTKRGRAALLEQQEAWRKSQRDASNRAELRGLLKDSQDMKAFQTYINPQRDRDALMERVKLQEGEQTTRQGMVNDTTLEAARISNEGANYRQDRVTDEQGRQFDLTQQMLNRRVDMDATTSAANLLTNGYNLALQYNDALNRNKAAEFASADKSDALANIVLGLTSLATPRRRYY